MDTIDYIECCRTLARFARALDESDFDGVAAQMTEEGVWHRQGERLEGRAAIVAALDRRPSTRLTRHLVTNIVGESVTPEQARLRCTVLVYAVDDVASLPAPMPAPASVLDYEDILVRQPDGRWLIAERRSQRVFADRT
jgi:ketosteroid isomerase-like protein